MGTEMTKKLIADGKAVLGIEFGSTRIKAVLIDEANAPIAEGAHEWENRLDHGIWTYTLEDIWTGLQDCYADLVKDVQNKYGLVPTSFAAIGISAMMHGYLAFNEKNELLVPFRTWRNTITGQAAEELTELFNYNIPQRWRTPRKGHRLRGDPGSLCTLAADRAEGHRRRRCLWYVPR